MKTFIKMRNLSLLALMMAFLSGTTLTGCSSSDGSSSDCDCAEGDWNCKDRCTQPGT